MSTSPHIDRHFAKLVADFGTRMRATFDQTGAAMRDLRRGLDRANAAVIAGIPIHDAAEFERAQVTGRQMGLTDDEVAELIDAEIERSRTTAYRLDWDRVRTAMIDKALGR